MSLTEAVIKRVSERIIALDIDPYKSTSDVFKGVAEMTLATAIACEPSEDRSGMVEVRVQGFTEFSAPVAVLMDATKCLPRHNMERFTQAATEVLECLKTESVSDDMKNAITNLAVVEEILGLSLPLMKFQGPLGVHQNIEMTVYVLGRESPVRVYMRISEVFPLGQR